MLYKRRGSFRNAKSFLEADVSRFDYTSLKFDRPIFCVTVRLSFGYRCSTIILYLSLSIEYVNKCIRTEIKYQLRTVELEVRNHDLMLAVLDQKFCQTRAPTTP